MKLVYSESWIISYQEKLGNYDISVHLTLIKVIISYQEKLGNYDRQSRTEPDRLIISYQEKLGNYDSTRPIWIKWLYYIIPRKIRELWRGIIFY